MEITIKHITLLILSLISILKVFGQSWDVTILGTVTDLPSKKPIEHQRIVLMSNNDTLDFQFTKGIGDFSIETFFSVENDYYLFLDADYQNSKKDWIKLHAKGDTTMIHMFHIDLIKLPIIKDRFDNNAYYEINETKEHQNFDLTYFLNLFTENPTICIRFVQTIHPDEKKSVALKRKKAS